MTLRVVFHRLAAQEARDAETWYAGRSQEAADRFRVAVLAATERLVQQTATHPLAGTRFRYVRVHRFPYRLIYVMQTADTVRVIAVAHDRRRPAYWRGRQ